MQIFGTILGYLRRKQERACAQTCKAYGQKSSTALAEDLVVCVIHPNEKYIPSQGDEVKNIYLDEKIIAQLVVRNPAQQGSGNQK